MNIDRTVGARLDPHRVRAGRIIAGLALAMALAFAPVNFARGAMDGLVVDGVVVFLAVLQLAFIGRANRLFPAAIATIGLLVVVSLVGAAGFVHGYFWANAAPLLLFFFAGQRWGALLTAIVGAFVAALVWAVPPVAVPPNVGASVVVSFAAVAAFAFVNERQRLRYEAELQRVSETDGLTGLANRRRFETRHAEESARAARTGRPYAVILLDADHFKDVNDRYGHAAGDAVLQAVGELLGAQRRAADVAARLGGDEFALLLPDTERDAARTVADRVHAASLAAPGLRDRGVTLTVGLAAWQAGEDARRVLARADEAMYEAKRLGRNRVEG